MHDNSRRQPGQKLGSLLVAYKLITQDQLNEALRLQAQSGQKLGSVLVELEYLEVEALVKALGMRFGLQPVNLFKGNIPPEILRLLPFDKIKKYQALPLAVKDPRVMLAMVNPNDMNALKELQFYLGRSIDPLVVPSFQMIEALRFLDTTEKPITEPLRGETLIKFSGRHSKDREAQSLRDLLKELVRAKGSDLLLVAGAAPSMKKNNELCRIAGSALTPLKVEEFAGELMTSTQAEQFAREKEIDFSYIIPELGRFRVNIYRQRNSISIAARHIIEDIPSLEELGLPSSLKDLVLRSQGLILITGPVGHGKSTTMAALVDIINQNSRRNVITLEDPIEFMHRHKKSNINQREVGVDTQSFSAGLRHIFREAPDVIVIGEMRDPESFAIALEAADTGHLVISCLHANSATLTIDRIIDIFHPSQQHQIRMQFAENMLTIINQRLLPKPDGSGMVLACEQLTNSQRVKNIIREGKEHNIRSLLQQSNEEFRSLDVSLAKLCTSGKVSVEKATQYCQDAAFFRNLVR